MFSFGFNFWLKHDSATFHPERVLHSWYEDSPHFIISAKQRDQGFIELFDSIQVVIDENYIQPFTCQKSIKCMYESRHKSKIDRHEKSCFDRTRVKYKQKCFGNHPNVREELLEEGIIDTEELDSKRLVSFDIESVNCTENVSVFGASVITGCQEPISIGYYANFGDYKGVILRKDMEYSSGIDLVKQFLKKMRELQTRHYELIPENIKQTIAEYKEMLKTQSLSVDRQTKIKRRLWYLRSLTNLKIIGFNSSRYDLPVLLKFILETTNPEQIKVIKKGSTIFDMRIGKLCFQKWLIL